MKKMFANGVIILLLLSAYFPCKSQQEENKVQNSQIMKPDSTMKVLLLNGSPHEKGCTYTALTEVAKALNEDGISTEIIWVAQGEVAGCTACNHCFKTGKCVYNDIVNQVAEKTKDADAFIFGSPVYYSGVNGTMVSFLNRLFRSTSANLAYKPGAAVVSARRAGTTATLEQLNQYFTINNMPVVSSQYWNMVHGNTPEEVMQDTEGLQIMRTLGHNMAWLLKSIEAGKKAGINIPQAEEVKERTNFIR